LIASKDASYIDLGTILNLYDLPGNELRLETANKPFTFIFTNSKNKQTLLSGLLYLVFEMCGLMM
jgi:hypothetical protein